MVLLEMAVGNAEWLFSLQIKYPLYSAHSSAKRVTKYLWQPAAMRKKVFRLGPFSFATPAFTGCAFFCTDTPLAHDAQIKLSKLNEPVVPGTWNLIGSSAQQVISATHKL